MKLDDPRKRVQVELADQERFDREVLREPWGESGSGRKYLASLLGRHFAGHADRPTPAELDRALRSPRPDRKQRGHLYNLFGSMRFLEFRDLAHEGGLPVYDLARALRHSGAKPVTAIRWLNQFAASPGPAAEAGAAQAGADREQRPADGTAAAEERRA